MSFSQTVLDVRNHTAQLMDSATLESIYRGVPVRREEVFNLELIGGAGI